MATRKEQHEMFVSNLSGGDMMEIYGVCATFTLFFIIAGGIRRLFGKWPFVVDIVFAVTPGVLLMTVLSDFVFPLLLLCLAVSLLLSFLIRRHESSTGCERSLLDQRGRPALLGAFRGTGMLSTSICILAVDFPAFPRRFAKTETFGTGLMDFGVGGFALMMGLVAPETRGQLQSKGKLLKTIFPLLLLGFVRIVSVKASNYQEHISEYGTHWNFFFTLALAKLLSTALLRLTPVPVAALALLVTTIHELSLRLYLSEWILQSPRNNLLTANKEGIGSILGYVSLLLWGVAGGQWVHRSFSDRSHTISLAIRCAAGLLGGLAVSRLCGPVCRAMANGAYVAWTTSVSCLLLLLLQIGHIVLSESPAEPKSLPSVLSGRCVLGESNESALVHFLVSNLLTGAVNLLTDTLATPDPAAVGVLLLYQCAVATAVHGVSVLC